MKRGSRLPNNPSPYPPRHRSGPPTALPQRGEGKQRPLSQKPASSDDLFGDALSDLGRCIRALGEHRNRVVLTGGMVPLFYRHLPGASPVYQRPLTTFDMDWTVPRRLPVQGARTIDESLRDAQFVSILAGDESRIVYYQHRRYGCRNLAPVHIEFLSPRQGSPSGRKGEDRTAIQVQRDLWAQGLPYLELLLHESWEVDAGRIAQLGIPAPCPVRVPNPATYIAQKILVRSKRTRARRDKDLAYVFDVATVLRTSWAEIGTQLSSAEKQFPGRWFRAVRSTLGSLFASPVADGPIAVSQQYRDAMGPGAPAEEAVFQIMTRFLNETGMGDRA